MNAAKDTRIVYLPSRRGGKTAVLARAGVDCGQEPCEHSVAEHNAFDAGVYAGEVGKKTNPFVGSGDENCYEAWETGHSVGVMNRREAMKKRKP